MSSLDRALSEFTSGRLSRRQFFMRAFALGLSAPAAGALLSACSDAGDEPLPTPSVTFTAGNPKKLYLYSRQNELAPANKASFFEQTGITIVETFFDDNESLLAHLKAGATGYDLIVPSSYMVPELVREGLLQPLRVDMLTNIDNLAPGFAPVGAGGDLGAGDQPYGVPHVWGTTGFAVRTDMVKDEVTSWAELWDKQHQGRITMLDDEREALGAGLKLLGCSLNTTDPDELAQATDKLIEQRKLVRAYDSFNARRSIVAGVPLVHTRCAAAKLASEDLGGDKVDYVLPREGFTVWTDNLCVPLGARSVFAAHLFMDFMLEGTNAADLVNHVRYQTPNAAAEPFLDAELVASRPSDEDVARGEAQGDVGDFAGDYTAAWSTVRAV